MFDHYANHHLYDQFVQITICLIMMQILYSYQIVILMHNTAVYMYLHSYKINFLIL